MWQALHQHPALLLPQRSMLCHMLAPPLALHDLQSNWLVSSQVYPGGGILSPTTTQVYAPTIPGFGRSEKPALPYTQGLWQAFLREFVVELVRRPVVVAGNSIGGYLSACLAGGSPRLVKGAPAASLLQPTFRVSGIII